MARGRQTFTTYVVAAIAAMSLPACDSNDEERAENSVYKFDGYDIMLSNYAPADNVSGRINRIDESDPWRPGRIVYVERDGLFMYRDSRGYWSHHWGYASYYGTYDSKGVRPTPGSRYYCSQTATEYIANEEGKLIPTSDTQSEITVTTWNIGGFNNGNSGSFTAKSADDYQAVLSRFSPIIGTIDADLTGFCEYLPSIYAKRSIRDDLMGDYPYDAISKTSGSYLGKALFSRFPLSNVTQLIVHSSIALEADAIINGRVFKVCVCHPVWWSNDVDPNLQTLKYLANRYKYVERAILMGDFNILRSREEESLRLFTEAGFTPANSGRFGSIVTSYNSVYCTPAIDNIMVKGAEISSVSVLRFTPEGLDPQNPRLEDELLWDAANPSDHFPLTATLKIK